MWRPLRRIPGYWLQRLPARLAVPVLSTTSWPRSSIEDLRTVAVPDPFRLLTYWLRIGEDEGPALSLFHDDDEILRIDCLRESPHIHYGLAEAIHRGPAEPRVYLPPASAERQIDRAVFELAHNVAYCIGLHHKRSVRTAAVDQTPFVDAANEVGRHLRDLLARHGN